LVAFGLFAPTVSQAEDIPVAFYLSPNDDGSGGATVLVGPGLGPRAFAIWGDAAMAGGGGGVFSVQDVILRANGGIAIASFTCSAPNCLVRPRSDDSREIMLTAGDDSAATPGLAGKFRLGSVTVDVTSAGELRLVAGTALDGNALAENLEIEALANEGVLLPEPTTALQGLIALATLASCRRLRRGHRSSASVLLYVVESFRTRGGFG
jgi:hypothetical protein